MKVRKWMSSLVGLGLFPSAARAEWKSLVRRLPALGPAVSFLKDSFAGEPSSSPVLGASWTTALHEGLPLEGAWSKILLDHKGRAQAVVGRAWAGEDPELAEKILEARRNRPSTASLRPSGDKPADEWPVELVLVERDGRFEPTWSYAYIPADESAAVQRRLCASQDPKRPNFEQKVVSQSLASQSATAFTQSPLVGPVQEVVLRDLDGGDRLTSPSYRVWAAKGDQAEAGERGFHYDLSDPRFDQVQVYYYVQEYLQRLGRFGLDAVRPLEIKVQVGEASNVAFYYRGKIRLGNGDGVRFSERLRDPSVVLHEVTHAVIDQAARLPSDGVGGAINEAFADYFAASFLGDPRVGMSSSLSGEPVRDLSQSGPMPVNPLEAGVYETAQAIASTFWDLRTSFGADTADSLLAQTLLALGPTTELVELREQLMASAGRTLPAPRQEDLGLLLDRHAWPRRGELPK